MERIVACIVLCLVVATSATAADVQKEQSTLQKQLNAYVVEHDQLTAERTKLAKRADDLEWTGDQLIKQFQIFKSDRVNLDRRQAAQAEVVREHGLRCYGTSPGQRFVDACNAEAARINVVVNAQNQENQALNKRLRLIKAADESQTVEISKVAAADKVAYDRLLVIANVSRQIVERLKAIKSSNDDCREAIAAVDADPSSMLKKERMHAICGEIFDGNQ